MPAVERDVAMSTAVEAAVAELGALAQRDVPLGPMTTYRVGGSAAVFVRVDKADQLGAVARARAASALPMLVVGRGSNLLVADGGFDGIAVQLGDFVDRIDIDEHTSVVTAGAAVRLPVLARRTAAAGLAGFEWAVGVPGSIGGAVRMNAGGHGSDMAASLLDADVADLGTDGTVHRLGTDDLHLRFRGSGLTSTDAVVSARLRLRPGDVDASEAMVKEIVAWRRAHQPGGQNAGSVFVNPVPGEVSAGQLVDDCGLRGHRIGSAYVSEIHANFIQSDDAGSADDVVRLMRHVREVVLDRTGYALRSEIRLIGFGEPW